MSETPRYATLQDYVRVLRRQRWLILAVTMAFTAGALAIALAQSKSYTASAQMSFRDVLQDLQFVAPNAGASQTSPQERAAANAALINRPAVSQRVKQELGTTKSADELAASVSASVGAHTNLVTIQAHSGDPKFAADLANEYARQTTLIAEQNLRRKLDKAVRNLEREVRSGPSLSNPTFRQSVAQQQLTQLQTVRNITRPAEIERLAEVPGTPSSPKPVRNAILGALIGLTLGIVAAFLRDSLDRRLRGTHEVHEQLDLPVLGRVNDTALGYAGLAANGAGVVSDTDLEAFRVLRTNLDFLSADSPVRSVVVTSGLPEEGKSTVAASLAGAAAVAGKRTLLVECDLRRASLAARLALAPEPGLTDYLVGRAKPADILQTIDLGAAPGGNGSSAAGTASASGGHGEGDIEPGAGNGSAGSDRPRRRLVCIVAGGPAPHPAELLGSERCKEFLRKIRKAYDLVVLDTSPLLSVADALELVPHVDGVILCVRLSQTTREEAKATKSALEHLPPRPTGVVVTGVGTGEDDAYGYYTYSYGYSAH